MKYLLLIIALLSSAANAEPVWHTSKINSVYPLGNGQIVIMFSEDNAECKNTSVPQYFYLAAGENGVTEAGYK